MDEVVRSRDDIERSIRDRLAWDGSVDEQNISVEVTDSTIKLTGSVPGYMDRKHAEIDAFFTPEVMNIDNQLVVSYPGRPSAVIDQDIEWEVRNKLSREPDIDVEKIDVAVDKGVVTLGGAVDTHWKKTRVAERTALVPGVVAVHNRITLVPTGAPPDEEIARKVLSVLANGDGIDIDALDVEVAGGAVTLFGTVPDTDAARRAGEAATLPDGVTSVNNNLIVI